MDRSDATVEEQLARAASDFERARTGRLPRSVHVMLHADTLVITLSGVLSAAEQAVALDPTGAAHMQELHRQLFASASGTFCREIRRITGKEVRDAGAVGELFASGTTVQVYLLDTKQVADTRDGSAPDDPPGMPRVVHPGTDKAGSCVGNPSDFTQRTAVMLSSYPVHCPHEGCDWQGNLVPSHLQGGAGAEITSMHRAWFQCPRCQCDWEVSIEGDRVVTVPVTGKAD